MPVDRPLRRSGAAVQAQRLPGGSWAGCISQTAPEISYPEGALADANACSQQPCTQRCGVLRRYPSMRAPCPRTPHWVLGPRVGTLCQNRCIRCDGVVRSFQQLHGRKPTRACAAGAPAAATAALRSGKPAHAVNLACAQSRHACAEDATAAAARILARGGASGARRGLPKRCGERRSRRSVRRARGGAFPCD